MSTSIERKRTKHQFGDPEPPISHELAKAASKPLPLFSRLLAGGISAIFFGTLIWASVSKVDEVAVAQGELIPSTHVQPIKALSGGLIGEVFVEEGDLVQAGDDLVKLDPTISEAEFRRLQQLLQSTHATIARLEAELEGGENTGSALQDQLLASRLSEFAAEINRQQGVVKAAQAELQKLQVNFENAQVKEQSLEMLVTEGAVPRLDYLDAKNQVASLKAEISAKEQEIYQAQQELERLQASRKSEILTQIEQLQQEEVNLTEQLVQAEEQRDRETVEAPVAGTVYDIQISKPGATVQSGEALLSIFPEGEELILEAKVLNRDIGFIKPNMEVKIKLETFPYQEFGILTGTVMKVSPNAIQEQEVGLVYPVQVKLEEKGVSINGEMVELAPGMSGTAEIIIRQKTILSFLIEPLIARWDSAFSVR
jgi:HlyD family secretion protein